MRIAITGERGIGKTTVCERVIREARKSLSVFGFLTYPILKRGERTGFYIVDQKTAEREVLASENFSDGPVLGRFHFSPDGIAFGLRALRRRGDLCVVDELGRLELRGEGFFDAVPLLKKERTILITTRSDFAAGIVGLLGAEFKIFDISLENRDRTHEKILKLISR
jgi:nucleoside-triphosphatase THEP1